ncbi:hypothetical protein N9091_00080 [bacterium]|nr:hypothetical protein [bacterium]
MSRTKYLKFGARADKNLSDLDSAPAALNNILDNLSSELDDDGNSLNFSSADLDGLLNLAKTGMATDLSVDGRPVYLESLAGTNVQATDSSNTLIDVSPRVTYQDYINNYRAVLGNPLWTSGGSGPAATFIPSDRLNANITDNINTELKADLITSGNRYRLEDNLVNETQMNAISVTNKGSPPAVGDIFVAINPLPDNMTAYTSMDVRNVTVPNGNSGTANANALTSNQLFTTKTDLSLNDIVGPEDFWTNGDFIFSYKLHKSFSDTEGGIQWTGYQSGRFLVGWKTTGFFIIEEDVNNDNNWTLLKAVTSSAYKTAYNVTWETVDSATVIKFGDNTDFTRVCQGMLIEIGGTQYAVEKTYRSYSATASAYEYFASLNEDVGSTDSSGSIQTFLADTNISELDTGTLPLTPITRGGRRRVRYTVFWPTVTNNQPIERKYFNEYDPSNSGDLKFNYFYADDGASDVDGQYSFKYFYDNRVNFTQQKMSTDITVSDTLSLEYTPPQIITDTFVDYSSNQISRKQVQIQNSSGSIIGATVISQTFTGISVGDWVVVCNQASGATRGQPSSNYHAFQVIEKKSNSNIFLDPSYTTMGIPEHTVHDVLFVKNIGLKGIFQSLPPLIGTNQSITQVHYDINSSLNRSMDRNVLLDIAQGDLGFKVEFDMLNASASHVSHDHPFYAKTVTPGSTYTGVTWEPHANYSVDSSVNTLNSENFGASPAGGQNGIIAVYSSRGLVDTSSSHECGGVYGLEVVAPPGGAPATSNSTGGTRIYVKSLAGGVNQIGYYVYFIGSDPAAPVIDQYDVGGNSALIASHSGAGASEPYIEITSGLPLNADLASGTTIVVVPSGSYGGDLAELRKNREYCVIPLNTAPPFASTNNGLATTSTYPNLMVSELEFSTIDVKVASNKVVDLESITWGGNGIPDKKMSIQHGTDTYSILINSDTYS